MIKKNQRLLNQLNMVIDGILVVLSYILGCYLWLDVLRKGVINMADWSNGHVLLLACLYAGFVLIVLMLFGFYNTTRRRKLKWKVKTILFGITLSLLIGTTLLFLFELQEFSKGVLFLFYVFSLLFLIGKYWVMRHLLRFLRKKGYNIKHVLVIGTGHLAQQYVEDIRSIFESHWLTNMGEKHEALEQELPKKPVTLAIEEVAAGKITADLKEEYK